MELFTAQRAESIVREVFKRLGYLELKWKEKIGENYQGAWRSRFKGEGLEFEELRKWDPADDVRKIDWRASARKNELYVKVFSEERRANVVIWMDSAESMRWGTNEVKYDKAFEVASFFAMLALKSQDRVGVFADRFYRPSSRRDEVMAFLQKMYLSGRYSLEEAVLELMKWGRRCVFVIISDFNNFGAWRKLMAVSVFAKVVPVFVYDKIEADLPVWRVVEFSGKWRFITPWYAESYRKRWEELLSVLRRNFLILETDLIELSTAEDVALKIGNYLVRS